MSYLLKGYMDNVISSMIAARYAEKALEPDCPYLQANAGDGSYLISSTKDAFTLTGVAKPGKIKEAYAAVSARHSVCMSSVSQLLSISVPRMNS